jgi:hypothetical protein
MPPPRSFPYLLLSRKLRKRTALSTATTRTSRPFDEAVHRRSLAAALPTAYHNHRQSSSSRSNPSPPPPPLPPSSTLHRSPTTALTPTPLPPPSAFRAPLPRRTTSTPTPTSLNRIPVFRRTSRMRSLPVVVSPAASPSPSTTPSTLRSNRLLNHSPPISLHSNTTALPRTYQTARTTAVTLLPPRSSPPTSTYAVLPSHFPPKSTRSTLAPTARSTRTRLLRASANRR